MELRTVYLQLFITQCFVSNLHFVLDVYFQSSFIHLPPTRSQMIARSVAKLYLLTLTFHKHNKLPEIINLELSINVYFQIIHL